MTRRPSGSRPTDRPSGRRGWPGPAAFVGIYSSVISAARVPQIKPSASAESRTRTTGRRLRGPLVVAAPVAAVAPGTLASDRESSGRAPPV